jgi:hypothetical protein
MKKPKVPMVPGHVCLTDCSPIISLAYHIAAGDGDVQFNLLLWSLIAMAKNSGISLPTMERMLRVAWSLEPVNEAQARESGERAAIRFKEPTNAKS